ncbi:MAG: LTA synthase family protein [Oscillospiraceae bacterium]
MTTYTEKKTRAGMLYAALPGAFALLYAGAFIAAAAAGAVGFLTLALSLALGGALIAAALLLRRHAPTFAFLPSLAFCALNSYAVIQLLSLGSFGGLAESGAALHAFGALWIFALYLAAYAVSGGVRSAAIAGGGISLAFGIANYTLQLFRGRPFLAIDFASIRTALNVAGNYEFKVTALFVAACAMAIATAGVAFFVAPPKKAPRFRPLTRIFSLALAGLYTWLCLSTPMLSRAGLHILWDTNGFEESAVMYFAVTAQRLNVSEPEGYSQEALNDIAAAIPAFAPAEDRRPNIIAVMSEAFSDLSVLGELETNVPVAPFTDSLTENTVRGYVCSSVFGGNTANSEYEFLTGDSMAFVPTGSSPYQLYVNYETDTLVSLLKRQGYKTSAMHPYLASGWNRPEVYSLFGFDNIYFKDDFENRDYLRNYVTDMSNFENLVAWFEEKSPDERVFFFNITMQNHGGYNFDKYESDVCIAGHEGEFPQTEQYLTLINESDAAMEYLIDYFSGVSEPVIVLFFGDHQPSLEKELYDLAFGHDSAEASLEETQRKYLTPFFIWANYDIDERDAGVTSMNYLSSLLMDTAGLQKSGYQSFLSELSGRWPAITAGGALGADGVWRRLSDADFVGDDAIADYKLLQYNHLFDPEGLRSDIFALK